MPGGLLSNTARELVASELVAAVARALDADSSLVDDDDGLDIERATEIARKALDALQSKQVMAVRLTDDGLERSFMLQDLPIGVIDDIARKHNVGWVVVTDYPLEIPRLGVAKDLVAAVADQLKMKAPRRLTARDLVAMFVAVPDDVVDDGDAPGVKTSPLPGPDGDESSTA